MACNLCNIFKNGVEEMMKDVSYFEILMLQFFKKASKLKTLICTLMSLITKRSYFAYECTQNEQYY